MTTTITICFVFMISGLTTIAVNAQQRNYRPLFSEYDFNSGTSGLSQFDEFNFGSQQPRRQARRIIADHTPKKGRPFNYGSEEYRNFESDEDGDDDRSYTVGAQINVQHPSPVRKYREQSSEENRATSYTNFRISHDETPIPPHKSSPPVQQQQPRYTKSKSRPKKPLFKPFRDFESESAESNEDDSNQSPEFGYDKAPRNFKPDFQLKKVPNLYPREYSNVASKKQIAKYIEDQQKLIDDAIQSELLNDPNPSAKGQYQQFLKAKDDERIEKEYEEELKRKPQALFKPNFAPKRRQPRKNHQNQRRPKVVNPPKQQRGLGGFRSSVPQSMTFHIDV